MGFWLLFFVSLAFQVVGELLRPKQKQDGVKPSGLSDFSFPTADSTRIIPRFWGTCKLQGPNVTWFGDLETKAIKKKVKTGIFSSTKVEQGHKYYLGVQLIFGYGKIDELIDVLFDDKSIFGEDAQTGTQGGYGASGAFAALAPGGSVTVGGITVNDETEFYSFEMDNPELLSDGDPKEGVSGPVKIYKGTFTQPANAYLQGQWAEVETSGFRPLCYAVLEHCYLGNSDRPPPMALVARCTPNPLGLAGGKHNIAGDANAANMCYEIMTDLIWGMKIPASKIDIDSFIECGNTIADEGLGVSMIVETATKGRTLLAEILRHVDGVIYPDPETGLYTMRLARGDYDVNDLPVFDKTNVDIQSIEFSRVSWEDTKSTTIINFVDRNANFKVTPVRYQNPANVYARRGQIDSEQIDFLGYSNVDNANAAAARTNKTVSAPLCKLSFNVNRGGYQLRPASVVRFNFPEFGFDNLIVRIVDINYGSLDNMRIQCSCTEDIFSVSAFAFEPPPDTNWTPPSAIDPTALAYSQLWEPPYQLTQVEARIVAALGARNDSTAVLGFEVWSDDAGGTNYVLRDRSVGVLCAGTLQGAFDIDDATLTIDNVQDPDLLEDATDEEVAQGLSLLVIDDEIMAWKTHVVNMDGSVTFGGLVPAVFDTVLADHADGATVYILNDSIPLTSPIGYSEDLTITAKLPTFTETRTLALADTPQKTITTQSRARRPNPPGNFKINGSYPQDIVGPLAGTLTITYADRNKLTDGVVAQSAASTSREPGVTYTMLAYNDDTDTLLLQQENIAGNTISFAWNASLNLRIELYAVDANGEESLYPQTAVFAYTTGGSTIIDVIEEDPDLVAYNFPYVEAVATADVVLSAPQTIDGVALVAGNRVLVTAQATGSQNGIYVVKAGAWTRAADADASDKFFPGKMVFVRQGTDYPDSVWAVANDAAITLGTTTIEFKRIGARVLDSIADSDTINAPSRNAVFDALALKADTTYVDGKILDSIADSDTTHAPSRNAVFDALALKADTTYVDGKVLDSIADSDTTHAPSRNAVFDALALKADTTYVDGKVLDSIADGDTTHAPSRNAVFDALASKADTSYVDATLAGLSWKQAVRAATTAAGTLATSFENGDTIDGVVLATGDRILIKDQAAGAENGIYVVAASGAPTRANDANSGAELVNASLYVSEGTTNADTQWTCTTNAPITPGTTPLTFAQLTSGGYTDTMARAAVVIDSIANGDVDHAPSRNAVYDALLLKQDAHASLTSIAGLTTAANTGIYTTALNVYATYTLTAGGRALGGVAGTADTVPYFSAANTASLTAITSAARSLLGDTVVIRSGTPNTYTDEQTYQHANSTKRNRIDSAGGGQTSVTQTHGGLMINTTAMNATNKYGTGLMFGCLDTDFTTRNPKLLVAFVPFAREAFTSDTAGGSGGEFFALPLVPGADPTPVSCGYFTTDGWTIPLATGASAVTQAATDSSTKIATTAFVHAVVDAKLAAGGNGGPLVPLGETVLGAAATSITSPTFDMSVYSSVRWEFAFDNATASAAVLSLFANADTTSTNYYEQAETYNNATGTFARANDARIGNMDANETCTGIIDLKKDANGKVRGFARISRGAPASIITQEFSWVWNDTTNPTSLTIQASVATSIASGGKMTGWGLKAAAEQGEGTAFPGSPRTSQRFFRTDLGLEFYYDGTRWLSTHIFTKELRWTIGAANISITATTTDALRAGIPSFQGGSDLYLLTHRLQFLVAAGGTALSASHKWVGDVRKMDSALATTTIATKTIDSGSSGAARVLDTNINALLGGSTYFWFVTTWTKTGTPGALQALEEISYRVVAT